MFKYAFIVILLLSVNNVFAQNSIMPTDLAPSISKQSSFCYDAGIVRKILNDNQYQKIFRGKLNSSDNVYSDIFVNASQEYVFIHSKFFPTKNKFMSCYMSLGKGALTGAAF